MTATLPGWAAARNTVGMTHALVAGRARTLSRLIAAVTTVTSATGPRRLHGATKMLLAPSLQAELVATPATNASTGVRPALLLATTASTVGDWFMYREGDAPSPALARREMRRGATAFAAQQMLLVGLMARRGDRPRPAATCCAAGVLGALAHLETGHEAGPPDPVLTAYGLTLGAMAATAQADADPRVRAGGALFLASDALIIVRQHLLRGRVTRAVAELAVMGSYAAALTLLVHGLASPAPRQ